MATFVITYGKEIFALAVPVVAWVLNRLFQAKAKLHVAIPHSFHFIVQEPLRDAAGDVISPTQTVNTRSITISNAGRLPATKVELVFNWHTIMNIWPPRHFEEFTEPDHRYTLIFDSLAPNEQFVCELLSVNSQLPDLVTARSDQCIAKEIVMYPQPRVATWKIRSLVVLVFSGAALLLYLLLLLLQFVLVKTPLGH